MSRQITLPELFERCVGKSRFEGQLRTFVNTFDSFLGDPTRGLLFFPEYTDHGIPHIQRVLDSAAYLISEHSTETLTATDVTLLLAGVLLHDCAMHLTPDGFLSLVNAARSGPLVQHFDRLGWRDLWREYYQEATHWDESHLRNIFGNHRAAEMSLNGSELVRPLHEIVNTDLWTAYDHKFVGEFVRRHHARLAHEIAIIGFPGVGKPIDLLSAIESQELRDLAGLIARSHNDSLRATFSYLEKRFHGRVTVLDSHPVYLMAVLRIADYLDMGPDRAPPASTSVRAIRSPTSRLEWAIPPSILEMRSDEKDTESIFIRARPVSAATFLKLRAILDGLQDELDHSWAVIAEVYSRNDDLSVLGLRLRRVRSNLDDIDAFRLEVNYIPREFRFQTASATLLRKLADPLYGDQPEVGIRELLQNAIDAVREATFLKGTDNGLTNGPSVIIRVQQIAANEYEVVVEDFGIGMTEDVLQDYFLRAGSTFRDSRKWSSIFGPARSPQVLRSGRFGIGVLAAFLLGEQIDVETRHINESPENALRFSCYLCDEIVEVQRCYRERHGTTIRVKISDSVYQRLCEHDGVEWDWFRWPVPPVERWIDQNNTLPKLSSVPEEGDTPPEIWHRLPTIDGFGDVFWTYGRAPKLVCNGINIGKTATSKGNQSLIHWKAISARTIDISLPIRVPSVAIVDKRGILPIGLQRYDLINEQYPFDKDLLADIGRDFIAFCLVFAPAALPPLLDRNALPQYPGIEHFFAGPFFPIQQWYFTSSGLGFQHWLHLGAVEFDVAYVVISTDFQQLLALPRVDADVPILPHFVSYTDSRVFSPHIALANLIGRSHSGLGQSTALYTHCDDFTLILPPQVDAAFGGYYDSQCDLRDVVRARHTLAAR